MMTTTGLQVDLVEQRLELVHADALLLPVDGQICRLGGAAAGALRKALPPDERVDEMDYLEAELARLKPLVHPNARAIDGVAIWRMIVVAAAYPHNVDGAVYSAEDCARMIRVALPHALAVAVDHGLSSIAATPIGTAYRMSMDQAIRAFVDGLGSAAKLPIRIHWSLPDPAIRQLAAAACTRLGLAHRTASE
jgi:hypothetical protein